MMVKQNIEQYVNMVKNTVRLPFAIKNSVIRDFKRLASISKGLVETVGDIDVLDGVYEAHYPRTSIPQNSLPDCPMTSSILNTKNTGPNGLKGSMLPPEQHSNFPVSSSKKSVNLMSLTHTLKTS